MPRRPKYAAGTTGPVNIRVSQTVEPTASVPYIIARSMRWGYGFARFFAGRILDRLNGDTSDKRLGFRLRQLFERLGGTAIKIGQQMAVRVDFLPFEACAELARLMDAVQPFSTEQAKRRIELLTGAPIEDTFAAFQDEPIGSASVACVWRGTLHDGRDVAIKIQRPDVGRYFAADLAIIDALTIVMEKLSVVRPDFFKFLRIELRTMFLSEVDFCKEASFQSMFRRYVKRDGIKWLATPRVVYELSSHDILTTEFVVGYSCTDVLRAVETADPNALATLASVNIDPAVLGDRVWQIGLWGRMECAFFHADPHPGNILVQPGNRLVMLDFGACGIMTRRTASHQAELSRRLINDDIAGGAALSLSMLAPLPNVDTNALLEGIEKATWDYHIMLQSKDAEWWERTTAALWVKMMEVTRDFDLPINLDVLMMVRATLLYDTLACRLNPKTNADNAFRKWRRAAAKRADRRNRKGDAITGETLAAEAGEVEESLMKGLFYATNVSRELPAQFAVAAGKGAFFVSSMLRLGLQLSMLIAVATIALASASWFQGHPVDTQSLLGEVLANPVVSLTGLLLLLATIRIVRHRLSELETEKQ